ncbi:tegument protein [Psittacid alphaherpesvirus 5]|uniref:Tegument protein n=1 Tax=Psittacid alphaherpesvirus 5 TaxID=2972693 RepID=A0A5P9JP84_9ALPH|nr:tegument protein [Psittacid alphaherpesvirus 5]QFU14587.1 tegument protein [Psittacid alphaherpesvirus 5]UOO01058.1 tegument protein [Psittacid alphaherpesvirus 5]
MSGIEDVGTKTFSEKKLSEILNTNICAWSRIRHEPLLTVLFARTAWGPRLELFLGPPKNKTSPGVSCYIYLTKPKEHNLTKGQYFAIIIFDEPYSVFACHVNVSPILLSSPDTFILNVRRLRAAMTGIDIPDITKERIPNKVEIVPCLSELTQTVNVPADPERSIVIAPGTWWFLPTNSIYYLRLNDDLKTLCPAGWNKLAFASILTTALGHMETCKLCEREVHVDAFNNLADASETAFRCPCSVPCRILHERTSEIVPTGDRQLLKLIFAKPVEKIIVSMSSPISANISDVIRGEKSDGRNATVKNTGWSLCRMPPVISRGFLCGCSNMKRACSDMQLSIDM